MVREAVGKREGAAAAAVNRGWRGDAGSIAEQHDLGDGQGLRMGNGDEAPPHVQGVGASSGPPVQPQLRRPAPADHLDVLPHDAARVACPERFHRRFLHGEAAGQVRHGIAPPRTISNLPFGEYARQEAVAVALQHVGNAGKIRGIQSDSDDVHDARAPA